MPQGIDAFRRKQAQKQERKAQMESTGPQSFTFDFTLKANQYAVIRFLEQGDDLVFATTHRIPVQGKQKMWFRDFICLDSEDNGTPCPACQSPNTDVSKRIDKGFHNVIWREAPVFQRDDQNKPVKGPDGRWIVVGREDQIALWKCSWTVHALLREKDSKFRGLMSRDWEIKRTGSTLNDTVYHIEPVDPDAGAQPMLIGDLTLAEKKYDLAVLTRPLSFQDFAQALNRGALPDGPQPTADRSSVLPTADSTFAQGPSVRASAFTRG